tara:strand:- start:2761 stop:3528 length:768 start_codon:yes stop_codon:yes gene_type:complete
MNITATIQARMGSSRLPGKVLADICGKPMLLWQVQRIKKSRLVDNVVVGTSDSNLDDEIALFCKDNEIDCFRGSETDVLNRIASLLRAFKVDVHVECYGDSPLIDPQIIDEFIGYFLKSKTEADFFSSSITTTYPPGLEVTVYKSSILLEVDKIVSSDDPLREHVGYNITRFPDRFKIASLSAPTHFFSPETYLEVDTVEDLEVMKLIFKHFLSKGQAHFGLSEILTLLKSNLDIADKNRHIERRWKTFRKDTKS